MNNVILEDLKLKRYMNDVESYFNARCRGDILYNNAKMEVVDIYVYRALESFIHANNLSKEEFFNSPTKKKSYRNILVSIMKCMQSGESAYFNDYPQIFGNRKKLRIKEVLPIVNTISKQYVDLWNNISNKKGDITYLKEYYSLLRNMTLLDFFKLDSSMRNHLYLISSDKNYGLDQDIYRAVESVMILDDISLDEFIKDESLREKFRNLYYTKKNTMENTENIMLSKEIVLNEMLFSSNKWYGEMSKLNKKSIKEYDEARKRCSFEDYLLNKVNLFDSDNEQILDSTNLDKFEEINANNSSFEFDGNFSLNDESGEKVSRFISNAVSDYEELSKMINNNEEIGDKDNSKYGK